MADHAQPNILLIMPDQMRGDCLSLEQHPCLLTPTWTRSEDRAHISPAPTPVVHPASLLGALC